MGMRKEVMIGTDDGAEGIKALMYKPLKLARDRKHTARKQSDWSP